MTTADVATGGKIWTPTASDKTAKTSLTPKQKKARIIAMATISFIWIASAVVWVDFWVTRPPLMAFAGDTFQWNNTPNTVTTSMGIIGYVLFLLALSAIFYSLLDDLIGPKKSRTLFNTIFTVALLVAFSVFGFAPPSIIHANEQLDSWTSKQLGVTDHVVSQSSHHQLYDWDTSTTLPGQLVLDDGTVVDYEYTKDADGNWSVHRIDKE